MTTTQQTVDKAYREGKQSYFKDIGTHTPTLKIIKVNKSVNPYECGTLENLAWLRGYNQDIRRVIV